MSNLAKPGLYEALHDFGADSPPGVLQLADVGIPTLQIGDLRLNYAPALRARLSANLNLAAGGAGVFSGFAVQARPEGFWLLEVRNIAAATLCAWVSASPHPSNLATPLWYATGSNPGEVRENISGFASPQDFIADARTGNNGVGPPVYAHRILQGMVWPNLELWIPGGCWLNVEGGAANTGQFFNVTVQTPARAAGLWT